MATNSGGWLYEANGTPVDKATADNAQARVLEIKQDSAKAVSDAANALSVANSYAGQIAQANTTAGSAVAIAESAASDVDEIKGPIDTRLSAVEVAAGYAPGDATDAAMTNIATQEDTEFRAALNAQSVQALQVKLGAEVVPGALDFPGLQAAADSARVSGRRLWAAGTLTTDQTLVIRSDADLGGLIINYTGNGVAVRVGETTASLFGAKGTLPIVRDANNTTAGSWMDSRIGIQMVNNDSCIWTVPRVTNFGVGLEEVGDSRGHAYNTITIGHLANNKINHRFRSVGSGWANQNTHIGGRFGQNSGEGVGVLGSRHVEIQTADANAINNNTWLGSSFEGNTPEFHADVAGTANMFLNCRWEASAGPKVRWQAGAVNNQILYGYGSNLITETHGTGATRNHVLTAARVKLQTSFGVLYESSSGNAGVADAVMGSGGIASGTDPATGYATKRTANATHMKRPADAFDRARLDHVNGRIYFGNGVAEPTAYVGIAGTSILRFETSTATTSPSAGGAGALPATPAGYMDVYVGGAVRKIPYY